MPHLPMDINYVTEEMVQKAAAELGESENKRTEGLIQLRNKMKGISDFVCPMDDDFLLMYLRYRKYDITRAVESIKRTYLDMSNNMQIVDCMVYENIKKIYDAKVINPLPYRDEDGSALLLVSFDRFDFDKMNIDLFMMALAVTEMFMVDQYPATQICGLKFIAIVKNLGVKHLKYVPRKYIILWAKGVSRTLPIRFKVLHILNGSLVIQWMWNFAKPLMSEKMKQRLLFHSTEDLPKYYDPKIIPKEFGGTLDYDNAVWLKKLKEYEPRYEAIFKKNFKYKDK